MTVDEELDALRKLRDAGTITDEQYERGRTRLLGGEPPPAAPAVPAAQPHRDWDEDEERRYQRARRKRARDWAMVLHLSLLAGHAVPLGGIIAPFVIWQTQKGELPELDAHGKNAANWLLSLLLYAAVSLPLCLLGVGIVMLLVLGALGMVFPVIAAIKANEGQVWRYPLSISFLQ